MGLTGISDLVKMAIFGQEKGKLKFDLLVVNLQVWDALGNNLHVLVSPKHQRKKGFNLGQTKHLKSQELKPKTKLEGKGEAHKIAARIHLD